MAKKMETGAASVIIDLTEGRITVTHGDGKTLLAEKKRAVEGDWNKLMECLRNDIGCKWLVR